MIVADFYKTTRIPGFIALGSLALCVFVLLAFLILPQEHTKRHYLNTSLTISIVMLEVSSPLQSEYILF